MKKAFVILLFFTPIFFIAPQVFATVQSVSGGVNSVTGILLYIFFAAIYIMTIHLAIAIGDQFNMFLMAGLFAFGGVIGFFAHSYELGFVIAIVLSLVFW